VARRGYYLLVASAAALAGVPGISTYAASKAGVEQFGNVLRLELAPSGVDVGVAYPSWIDTDLVRDQQRELSTFSAMLRELPGPLGRVTSLDVCAEALADAVARRARRVYVPRDLAPLAALRHLLTSALADRVIARHVRRLLPQTERELRDLRELGRAFGAHSAGYGRDPGEPQA
jgi:short-subunit dehydrogenase